MTKIKTTGFAPHDDIVYDDLEFDLDWRDPEEGTHGREHFVCKPRIASGILFRMQSGDNTGAIALIARALRTDDNQLDDNDEPIADTDSLTRYLTLTSHAVREVPGKAIGEVVSGLYEEYSNRRNPEGVAGRPTSSPEPSSSGSEPTGNTSTAKPRNRASTSARSRQT